MGPHFTPNVDNCNTYKLLVFTLNKINTISFEKDIHSVYILQSVVSNYSSDSSDTAINYLMC